jgi:hypothetical protein
MSALSKSNVLASPASTCSDVFSRPRPLRKAVACPPTRPSPSSSPRKRWPETPISARLLLREADEESLLPLPLLLLLLLLWPWLRLVLLLWLLLVPLLAVEVLLPRRGRPPAPCGDATYGASVMEGARERFGVAGPRVAGRREPDMRLRT